MNLLTARGLPQITPKPPNELVKAEMEHSFHIEDVKVDAEVEIQKRTLTSCCFRIDEKMSYFVGKITISLIIIALSSYELITNKGDCSTSIAYGGFLSTIIGFWLGRASG
jgi:hypothetical protein